MAGCLGYHKNCGGAVRFETPPSRKYGKRVCSSCAYANVPESDIVPEKFPRIKQKVSGVKRRLKKYDIKNWREVKVNGKG